MNAAARVHANALSWLLYAALPRQKFCHPASHLRIEFMTRTTVDSLAKRQSLDDVFALSYLCTYVIPIAGIRYKRYAISIGYIPHSQKVTVPLIAHSSNVNSVRDHRFIKHGS